MNLDTFLKIIDELNEQYSLKKTDEKIKCSVNVNGAIYTGLYEPNSFDGENLLILNKNCNFNKESNLLKEVKSFIIIDKIDAFTYYIQR